MVKQLQHRGWRIGKGWLAKYFSDESVFFRVQCCACSVPVSISSFNLPHRSLRNQYQNLTQEQHFCKDETLLITAALFLQTRTIAFIFAKNPLLNFVCSQAKHQIMDQQHYVSISMSEIWSSVVTHCTFLTDTRHTQGSSTPVPALALILQRKENRFLHRTQLACTGSLWEEITKT